MHQTQQPKLLDQVRNILRVKHYAIAQKKATFTGFIATSSFITTHPKDMGAAEVEAFLTYLAVSENVAA